MLIKKLGNINGQSATEFIISLPIILFIIVALVQLIFIGSVYLIMDYAAWVSSRVFLGASPPAVAARLAADRVCWRCIPDGDPANITQFIVVRDNITFGFPTARTHFSYQVPVMGGLGWTVDVRGASAVGLPRWEW